MAISKVQWDKAKGYYEAGLSLSEIKEKTGIDRSTISKKAKNQQWQHAANADYIEAKVLIAEKKSTKNQQVLNIADEVAEDKIRCKNLINSNAELLASKIPEILRSFEAEKTDEATGETITVTAISSNDIKTLSEANDKLAITLKVADRHAPKNDTNINLQQNQLVSENRKGINDFYQDVASE